MKHLILFLLILSNHKGCGQLTEGKQVLNSITYSVMTRGSSYNCSIDEKKIYIESTSTTTERKSRTISTEEWIELNVTVENIALNEIQNFKGPTTERTFDGARIATVVIKINGESYESEIFDEGSPPEELKSLIDIILALAETVE